MDIGLLPTFTERLRFESIGNPAYVPEKGVFEFTDQTLQVCAVLKLVRAVHGVFALDALGRAGLFIDMGAIYRCVADCYSEIYFLLENYPAQSNHVQKFLKEFFSKTIDSHLKSEEQPVTMQKIQSAVVRSITGKDQDEHTRTKIDKIYRTFCGYIHAGYSHIMQMYGGPPGERTFNVTGVPDDIQRRNYMQFVDVAAGDALIAIAHIAGKFELTTLRAEVMLEVEKLAG